ncbi:MAG: TIGR03943 family protein, partial [Anaerolineae bacterium]|nr:TIGR03943 family protein [Anaerolineae bacterium]
GLFKELQSAVQDNEQTQKPGKLKNAWVAVLLMPALVAMLGASPVLIFTVFVLAALVVVIRMLTLKSAEQNFSRPSGIPLNALVWFSIPLLLGTLVPNRPLSIASLDTRGMSLSAPTSLSGQTFKKMDVKPDDRSILDWIKLFNYESDLTPYQGQQANVVGFVYHDSRLKSGQFMVGRFAVTCCVADAFAIGMAVDWPDSANLTGNSWVNVKGPVEVLDIDGQKVPLIRASAVTGIDAPEQPYLYP